MTTLIPKFDRKNGGSTPSGAVNRPIYEKLAESVSVKDFGAVGDGIADDTGAFTNAFAASRSVYVPEGTFKINSMITVPNNTHFYGAGNYASEIKPSASLTGAAIEFLGSVSVMENLYINGTNTTGVIGVRVANQVLSDYTTMNNIYIGNFNGSNGKGLQVLNSVRANYYNVYTFANFQNCDIGSFSVSPAANNFPTIQSFYSCTFESATGSVGLNIRSGYEMAFHNCTFEGNYQAGVYIAPSDAGGIASQVFVVNFYGGHCEANWLSIASGAGRHAEFHIKVDGTGSGAVINNFGIQDMYFNGSTSEASAIQINKTFNFRLKAPVTQNLPNQIVIADAATTGWIDEYQNTPNLNGNTNVVIQQDINDNLLGTWTAWTPSYSAGGSMTIGTVTTTARYKLNGKTLLAEIYFVGTTGGVAGTNIIFTLPTGILAKNSSYTPAVIFSTGTSTTGYLRFNSTNSVSAYIMSGNYALGAGTGVSCAFSIEVQ